MRILRHRFEELWERVGARTGGAAVFNDLRERYGEPHRAYHTLAHIAYCLRAFDRVRGLVHDPDAVEMALWFHDAVYVIGADDNEEKSAALFLKYAKHAELQDSFVKKVARMIERTAHTIPPSDFDEQIVVDIDLSSLGESPDSFDRFGASIRKEYSCYSDEEYRAGRKAYLWRLLQRPRIYATDHFYRLYERAARGNIERVVYG